MTLTTKIWSGISARLTGSPDLGTLEYNVQRQPDIDLADGTAANKADLLFTDTRTLALSSNEDLDLAGGLADPFGNTLTFVKVKYIRIKAAAGNGGNIVVKPAASNGFTGPFGAATHTLSIPAGGHVQLAAPVSGWTVTASTGDLLNIANDDGAASASYDIEIVGTSA